MKRFVSRDKQSKRERKMNDRKKRASWGAVVPVTRVMPNGKAYSRCAGKRQTRALSQEQPDC